MSDEQDLRTDDVNAAPTGGPSSDAPPPPASAPLAAAGPPPTPIGGEDRLESLDVLRGFAVLGILAMNIAAFSGPFAGYSNPTIWPLPYEGGNRYAYWLTHTLFDLKMMSLFGMLFGAGVVVWGHKARTRGEVARVRWLWLRRMLWLFVIGMAHAWLLWEGDILVAYSLCGALVAWWVRRLPVAWLLVLSAVFFLVHFGLSLSQYLTAWMVFGPHDSPPFGMPEADYQAMRDGVKQFMAPTPEMLTEDIATHRGSYLDVMGARAEANPFIQIQGFAFYVFWRSTSMMLLGMALMRTGVFTGHRSRRFYAWMAAACYAIGLPMVVYSIIDNERHGFDPIRSALVGTQLNLVGSVPVALGHAAALLWLVKAGAVPLARRALGAVGQMALTNYLSQTLICTTLFYGYGFGLYGRLDRPALLGIVAAIWAVQLTISPWWLSHFRFGPAEWLWRTLTYLRRPVWRRAAAPGGQDGSASNGHSPTLR